MRTRDEIVRLALESLLALFERPNNPRRPEPEPAPEPVPERNPHPAGSNEWFRWCSRHPHPREPGISMNEIARGIKPPRPPRRPGQQVQKSNGFWDYY